MRSNTATRSIPSSAWAALRKRLGGFRCEVCDSRFPITFMVWQDGLRVCRTRCWRVLGKEDTDRNLAEAGQDIPGDLDVVEFPVQSFNVPAPTLVYSVAVTGTTGPVPGEPQLQRTIGSLIALTLTGLNFTANTTLATSAGAGIIVSAGTNLASDGTSITFTLSYSNTPAGDYDILLNGSFYALRSRYVRVRGG